MPIVKVIEVIASSENSFDEAVRNCISEVSKTVHNIDSVYIKDFKVHVKDNRPASFGVICEVSFRVDDHRKEDDQNMNQREKETIAGYR